LLAGKYKREGSGGSGQGRLTAETMIPFNRFTEHNWRVVDVLVDVAKKLGKPPAQVALNWLRARRNTIPIIGARKLSQLEDNLNCAKWSLSAKQLAQLNEASRIEYGFPRDFLDRPFVRDYLHGGTFDRIER